MTSPGPAELPKICCTECWVRLFGSLPCHHCRTQMGNVSTTHCNCQQDPRLLEEGALNEATLLPDNNAILELERQRNEDNETPFNGRNSTGRAAKK